MYSILVPYLRSQERWRRRRSLPQLPDQVNEHVDTRQDTHQETRHGTRQHARQYTRQDTRQYTRRDTRQHTRQDKHQHTRHGVNSRHTSRGRH